MAKKNNQSDTPSAESVLDQLAFLAEEDVRQRDKALQSNRKKRKEKTPAKETKPDIEIAGSNEEQAEKPVKAPKPKNKDNPFIDFVQQMDEAGKAFEEKGAAASARDAEGAVSREEPKQAQPVSSPDPKRTQHVTRQEPDRNQDVSEQEPKKPKKKKNRHKNKSKELKGQDISIGEEITKERAEELMSGKLTNREKGGHRATIIVHRTIVDTSGKLLDRVPDEDAPDTYEEPQEELQPVPEPVSVPEPEPEPEPEERYLILIRDDTGEAYTLDEDLTIGREEDNDIVIPEPDGHYVSGHHAQINIRGKDVYLRDMESTNGTFINGSRIGSKRLRDGQKIKFADIEFTVSEE